MKIQVLQMIRKPEPSTAPVTALYIALFASAAVAFSTLALMIGVNP